MAVRESRALPWPDMFDAFSVGEITVRERDVGDHRLRSNIVGKPG
jgi:hypothetical protein